MYRIFVSRPSICGQRVLHVNPFAVETFVVTPIGMHHQMAPQYIIDGAFIIAVWSVDITDESSCGVGAGLRPTHESP